jgi:serine/threonine protein kinase
MSTTSLFQFGRQFRPEASLSRLASILDGLANPLSKTRIKNYDLRTFDDIVRLGEGSSYVVDRGRFLEFDKELVAVKRTLFAETGRIERSDENGQYSFQDQLELLHIEIRALSHPPLANHPNIVKLLGYGWSVSQGISLPFVVVEYAELGTLDAYLRNSSSHPLEEKLQLAHDVACGLNALHACKVIHGDAKMANVLLYGNDRASGPIAKLSDFGHAVLWSATRLYVPLYGGTPLFNAPEVFAQDFEPIAAETMHKCDIYSYGLLLWGVLKDGLPYFEDSWLEGGEEDKIEFLQSVTRGWLATQAVKFLDTLTHLPEGMHDCLRDLLQRCLEYENARRPDIREVINLLEHLSTCVSEAQVIDLLPLQERILEEAAYTDLGPTEVRVPQITSPVLTYIAYTDVSKLACRDKKRAVRRIRIGTFQEPTGVWIYASS